MLHDIANRASLLGERTLQWISNAIERQLNGERFMAANQTPFELIHQRGLLSVRRYPMLAEDYIEVVATFRPSGNNSATTYKGTWFRERPESAIA